MRQSTAPARQRDSPRTIRDCWEACIAWQLPTAQAAASALIGYRFAIDDYANRVYGADSGP
jgi:hypothetical protein